MFETSKYITASQNFCAMNTYTDLTFAEKSQVERRELARGSWRDGEIENALLILRSVIEEEMTPRVAAEVFVTEAACLCALNEFEGALGSLEKAAPFVDQALARVQGCFYFHRALVYKNLGDTDAALTDYAGSLIYWEQSGESDYYIAALNNLANLYREKGDLAQARRYIDRAVVLLTNESTHYCNVHDTQAKILLAEGHLVCAWRAIQIAINAAGDNEIWKRDCLATRDEIKKQLLDFIVPVVTVDDVDRLKVDLVRYALGAAEGSIVGAAKLLNTSHQLIAYTAEANGLQRKPQRRKSIIKISS